MIKYNCKTLDYTALPRMEKDGYRESKRRICMGGVS
jgi:hypothetical protein